MTDWAAKSQITAVNPRKILPAASSPMVDPMKNQATCTSIPEVAKSTANRAGSGDQGSSRKLMARRAGMQQPANSSKGTPATRDRKKLLTI